VATAQRQSDRSTIVHAIWNGATEVARWDVLNGAADAGAGEGRGDGRQRVASVAWNGLDTTIAVNKSLTSVLVIARDGAGREIGRSPVTAVSQ
jgi:hypothetical protein